MRDKDFQRSRRRDFGADTYYPQPRAFGSRPRFSEPRFEAPSGPPVRAVVKWFNPEKGFGFAELSDGSGDAFLHGSVVPNVKRIRLTHPIFISLHEGGLALGLEPSRADQAIFEFRSVSITSANEIGRAHV